MTQHEPNHPDSDSAADIARRGAIDAVRARLEEITRLSSGDVLGSPDVRLAGQPDIEDEPA